MSEQTDKCVDCGHMRAVHSTTDKRCHTNTVMYCPCTRFVEQGRMLGEQNASYEVKP
jgi:hypothetical protein